MQLFLFFLLLRRLFESAYKNKSNSAKKTIRDLYQDELEHSVGGAPVGGVSVGTGHTRGSHCRSSKCTTKNETGTTTSTPTTSSTTTTTSSSSSSDECVLPGRCIAKSVEAATFSYGLDSIENWGEISMLCWNALHMHLFGYFRESINCAVTPLSIWRTWNEKKGVFEYYINITQLLLSKRAKVIFFYIVWWWLFFDLKLTFSIKSAVQIRTQPLPYKSTNIQRHVRYVATPRMLGWIDNG